MNHPKTPLRRFIAVLFATWFAGTAPSAFSKASYAGEDEMIERAEFIAIVNVTRVENAETKAEPFNYSEIAHATVERTLKGTLPKNVKLHGGESFICAQVHFTPGRHLVFLRRKDELLVGCNWHLGVCAIKGAQVEWFVAGKDAEERSWQPLDAVLERIKNRPAKPKDQ
jgi:hypothetical protein